MNLPLTIRRLARNDMREACQWYDRQRPGLGEQFVAAVEETVHRIGQTPEMHPILYRDVRRSLLRRFPYAVYYRVMPRRVVVIAVGHTSCDPKTWESRT